MSRLNFSLSWAEHEIEKKIYTLRTWPEVIKLFSSSTHLSMKLKLPIISEITKIG